MEEREKEEQREIKHEKLDIRDNENELRLETEVRIENKRNITF